MKVRVLRVCYLISANELPAWCVLCTFAPIGGIITGEKARIVPQYVTVGNLGGRW